MINKFSLTSSITHPTFCRRNSEFRSGWRTAAGQFCRLRRRPVKLSPAPPLSGSGATARVKKRSSELAAAPEFDQSIACSPLRRLVESDRSKGYTRHGRPIVVRPVACLAFSFEAAAVDLALVSIEIDLRLGNRTFVTCSLCSYCLLQLRSCSFRDK